VSHEDVLPALEDEIAAFWRQARVSARDAAREMHPRLDPTTFPMIAVLHRTGPMRVSELGATLFMDKSTVSRQVEAAARLGLVERTVDPTDARARLVGLSAAGQQSYLAVQERRRDRWLEALAGWDRADVTALTALLAKLRRSGVT
jgi:DNA-binding MarR family transcriptional regulator